ncbi:MAG: helix-turn-helix domain-containing protein [Vicinamibacterales bacterium]
MPAIEPSNELAPVPSRRLHPQPASLRKSNITPADPTSPWLDASEGAIYARVSKKLLYRAIRSGRLRAARVGGRRQVRLRREWLDAFIEGQIAGPETSVRAS